MKIIKIVKVEMKKNHQTNQDFPVFKIVDPKTNKLIDLRFTKGCKNKPEGHCNLILNPEDFNIDRSGLYPICYVKNVVSIEPFGKAAKDEGFEDYNPEK